MPFSILRPKRWVLAIGVLATLTVAAPLVTRASTTCERWVAPNGDDSGIGSGADPWRTMTHAAVAVPDASCTVWFVPGVYVGGTQIKRVFSTLTTFRSASPYQAVLRHDAIVVDIDGARNVVVEGFEMHHTGPGSVGNVVNVDEGSGRWAEQITIRNNIIHDSYDDDLLKVHHGARHVSVTGNAFYNQGPSEQHIDVNGVTDVIVQDNLFFNDFAASGRLNPADTKHYIVVKDSNELDDGLLGAHRVTIRRNIFARWQGGNESLIQVGNDGNAYLEAQNVAIHSNLFLGDGTDIATSVLGVAGAADVSFVNNTISGDLPVKALALRIVRKEANPMNERITIANNVFTDPTGTMGADGPGDDGAFTSGDPASVTGLVLDNNLYWNAGNPLPDGAVVSPSDDARRVVANPGLATALPARIPTVWSGSGFGSGTTSIRAEFLRIANTFARPGSVVAGAARADLAPPTDLFGNVRGPSPSLGAVEAGPAFGNPACPAGTVPSAGFTDVGGVTAEARWAIDCVAFHDVARGVGGTRFDPSGVVSRWQMAIFLTRVLDVAGVAVPTGSDAGFSDLGGLSAEAVAAVNALAELDVARGVGGDRFDPTGVVSRWQMAIFLTRVLDAAGVAVPTGSDAGFSDLGGLSAEAVAAVNALAELDVARGVGGDRFDPSGVVSRWQMAIFLTRVLDAAGVAVPAGSDAGFSDLGGLSVEAVAAVNALAELDVARGVGGDRFDPSGVVSRWQMAIFLTRTLPIAGVQP